MKRWSVLIWIQVARQWRRLLAVHLHLVQIIVPFRLVNYSSMAWQLSSYIPLASATFIYVGCGRAIYTLDLNKTAATPGGFGNRVEVLVCNYGPVDRTAPRQLYKLGQPGLCPLGTIPSDRYHSLCSKYKPYLTKTWSLGYVFLNKKLTNSSKKKIIKKLTL